MKTLEQIKELYKSKCMDGHPDSLSPIDMLSDRLKMIDNYIYRLERNGHTKSDFLTFYKNKSLEFKDAIDTLKRFKTH